MWEMRGEVGKKNLKKRWIIPHLNDVTWLIFLSPYKITKASTITMDCRIYIDRRKFDIHLACKHEPHLSASSFIQQNIDKHIHRIMFKDIMTFWDFIIDTMFRLKYCSLLS